MAGSLIRVIKMQQFEFSATGDNGEMNIPFPVPINVAAYTEGTLIARMHSGTIDSGGTISISVLAFAPTEEDPSRLFVLAGGTNPVAKAEFGNGDVPTTTDMGTLKKVAFSSNFGAVVMVSIKGKQPATAVTNLKGTFSADLSLKE
jgi:hypothetical protein